MADDDGGPGAGGGGAGPPEEEAAGGAGPELGADLGGDLATDPSLTDGLFDFGDEDDSSFLPPFANAANKALDSYIKGKEQELEATGLGIEECTDRITVMTEHLSNVQQELVYTQSRVDVKKKEIGTEDHLKQLSTREAGRIQEDVQKLQRKKEDLDEKLNTLQKDVYRGTEQLDQFKLLMNWNQEELEQWALASRQKEEDNLALQKYMRADDVRIKELNLHIEKMAKSVSEKKRELEDEVTETQAAQIMLDKTADDFKQLHSERQNLVRQWEEAIEAMKRRDVAIQDASEAFAEKKMELREKQSMLDAQARFLENEELNNKEVNMQISSADRAVGKLRDQIGVEGHAANELHEEVEVIKNTLAKTATELQQVQAQNRTLKEDFHRKEDHLEMIKRKVEKTKAKLENEIMQLDSLDDKSAELRRLQDAEEQKLRDVQKQVVDLKETMFKSGQKLFALRTKERDLIAEIAGGQSQNKNMNLKVNQLDSQIMKQQELLYNADFQIQGLERRVARASGERSDEETRVLNQRIEKLTTVLEGVNVEHTLLTNQLKQAEDNLKAATRTKLDCAATTESLNSVIAELKLETETTIRSVKERVKEKEEKLVASDILQLEVKRLRDIFTMRTDEMYGLENRKRQLEMSIEERKHEIEIHKETLQAQLKLLQEEMHRITLEMKERELRVEKLQSKFEVTAGRIQSDGGDEEKSQAYYVIKAAQEREELQREGDALDSEIAKAEKEVGALEATLNKLLDKNKAYRTSFRRVDQNQMMHMTSTLRNKLDKAYDKMKLKRIEERSLQEDLDQSEHRLSDMSAEIQGRRVNIHAMKTELAEGAAQKAELAERLRKVSNESTNASVKLVGSAQGKSVLREIALLELRELHFSALKEIQAVAAEFPKRGIFDRLAQAGIKVDSSIDRSASVKFEV